jgi:TolA-binding protein
VPSILPLAKQAIPVCVVLLAVRTGLTQEAANTECRLFESANQFLTAKDYSAAADAFENYLGAQPRSQAAPEAAFKLAATYVLLHRPADASKAYERLCQDYLDSWWAQLYLQTMCEEEQLLELANNKRFAAQRADDPGVAEDAIGLFAIYQARFADKAAASKKKEILYKLSECHRLAGDDTSYQAGMHLLAAGGVDDDWAKLAAFRLGDADKFQLGMDDLIDLECGDECYAAFLHLADSYQDQLDADEAVKCTYYRAHCLEKLEETKEALALYRQIIQDHADSPWASESAFWLAEHAFSEGRFRTARTAYRRLARQYPDSPRAVYARHCARWIQSNDKSTRELEEMLRSLFSRISDLKGNMAFTIKGAAQAAEKAVQLRVAIQSPDKFLIRFAYGKAGILLVNNSTGGWFSCYTGKPVVYHSKQTAHFSVPHGQLDYDPATDKGKMLWGWSVATEGQDDQPLFKVAHEYAGHLARLARTGCHFVARKRPDGRMCLHFEQTGWRLDDRSSFDVLVGPDHVVRSAKLVSAGKAGKTATLSLSRIDLGDTLPEAEFAVTLPDGAEVREVDEINPFEVLAQVMKVCGSIYDEARNGK